MKDSDKRQGRQHMCINSQTTGSCTGVVGIRMSRLPSNATESALPKGGLDDVLETSAFEVRSLFCMRSDMAVLASISKSAEEDRGVAPSLLVAALIADGCAMVECFQRLEEKGRQLNENFLRQIFLLYWRLRRMTRRLNKYRKTLYRFSSRVVVILLSGYLDEWISSASRTCEKVRKSKSN